MRNTEDRKGVSYMVTLIIENMITYYTTKEQAAEILKDFNGCDYKII
jgi:hypothetical protein